MTTKHTPGPWCLNNGAIIGNNGGTFVAEEPRLQWQATFLKDSNSLPVEKQQQIIAEAKANARLIAAAPELLEALRLARKYVADMPILGDEDLAIIDTAIAKATGEK